MKKFRSILFKTTRILVIVYLGLCFIMWSVQEALLFPASSSMRINPGDTDVVLEDVRLSVLGHETFAWYAPLDNHRGVALFSHGNAGNISGRVGVIKRLHSFGFSVLAYDYGGYGRSTGKPSETRCYADIRAMWNYLLEERGVAENEILLYGRSLGGGPTSELATEVTPGAIILESSFLSTSDVAWGTPAYRPFLWLLRHNFKNKDKVSEFSAPLLILHSREDEVIPYAHGKELYELAIEPKAFVEISGGHNNGYALSENVYRAGWEAFLTPIFGNRGL